jgi:PAS domain S-box-containing protein
MALLLLVEDEPIIALRETTLLKKTGYHVTHVSTGEDALILIEQGDEFDLILMDIDLGSGISGTEAAKRILDIRSIPLAFLSSHTEPKVVEQAESITSYGYIVKHTGDTVLLASIKMALALARSHKETRVKDIQVRESRDLLKTLFDSLNDGLVVMDHQFRIIQVNRWIEERYGAISELIGLTCYQVFQKNDCQCSFCPIHETVETHTNWKGLVPVPLTSGERGWYDISIQSLYGPDGAKAGYVEHIRDVTLQKLSEEQLHTSTKTQQLLLDVSTLLMGSNSQEKEQVLGNALKTMADLLGYHQVTIYSTHNQNNLDLSVQQWQISNPGTLRTISQVDIPAFLSDLGSFLDHNDNQVIYQTDQLSEGELKQYLLNQGTTLFMIVPFALGQQLPYSGALLVEYATNHLDSPERHKMTMLSLVQMMCTFQDRLQYQKILEESEQKTKLLADLTIEAILIYTDGLALMVNPSFCKLFGYQEYEILGRKVDFMIHPDDYAYVREQMLKERAPPYEVRFFHKNKSVIWVEIEARNFTLDGNRMRVAALRDIRERKDNQKRMRSLLAEKETLLREVHHRIKNNMASMMGILSLQADSMEHEQAALALRDARGRMQSMSVLYDKLYQSSNLEQLSIRTYITSLLDQVISLYGRIDISTDLELDDITLPVEVLSPLGILCNEIFTNSIKYGFLGTNNPCITVRFYLKDQSGILIIEETGTIISNGSKVAIHLDQEQIDRDSESYQTITHGGFGTVLIRALTEQLNGKCFLDKRSGWRYRFEIPLERYITKRVNT